MGGGRAPGADEGAHLEQPQAEVVLGGVADGSVHLQGGARRPVGGVGGRDLGRRHLPGRPGDRGAVDEGAGEVEADPHVGERVLEGLVLPDGPAELPALLHVVDRGGEQCLAEAQQLGGAGERGRVPGRLPGDGRHVREPFPDRDPEQPPGRVDRPDEVTRRRGVQAVVVDQQHSAGDVGVEGVRRPGRCRHGHGLRAVGDTAEQGVAPRQVGQSADQRDDEDRLHPRSRDGVPPQRLEGHHHLHGGGAQAARGLRHQEPADAEVGHPAQQLEAGVVVAGSPGSDQGRCLGGREQVVEGACEAALLVGQCEAHQRAPPDQRGSPRTRSATMLRWISLVPA